MHLGGLDWIDWLVDKGKANFESGNGYPSRYLSSAAAVLPLIRDGHLPEHRGFDVIGEDYFAASGWIGDFTVHSARIASCVPTDQLVIEAWDQS